MKHIQARSSQRFCHRNGDLSRGRITVRAGFVDSVQVCLPSEVIGEGGKRSCAVDILLGAGQLGLEGSDSWEYQSPSWEPRCSQEGIKCR